MNEGVKKPGDKKKTNLRLEHQTFTRTIKKEMSSSLAASARKDNENFTDRGLDEKSEENSSYFEEKPWLLDSQEAENTSRSVDTEVSLMESSKLIKKHEKKAKKITLEIIENEKKEKSNRIKEDFPAKEEIKSKSSSKKPKKTDFKEERRMDKTKSPDPDTTAHNTTPIISPMSTGRSLKTDVLLKTTEEIKEHLKPRVVISKKSLQPMSTEDTTIKLNAKDFLTNKSKNLASIFDSLELKENEGRVYTTASNNISSLDDKSVVSSRGLSVISESKSQLDVRYIIEDLDKRIHAKQSDKSVSKELDSVRLSPISTVPSSPSSQFRDIFSGDDSNRSRDTGMSLGKEIVRMSRTNLQRGKSFVPPCKRGNETQLSNDFGVDFFERDKSSRSAKPAKSKMSASSAGLSLYRTHSSASSSCSLFSDLSVRGSSFRTCQPKIRLKQLSAAQNPSKVKYSYSHYYFIQLF